MVCLYIVQDNSDHKLQRVNYDLSDVPNSVDIVTESKVTRNKLIWDKNKNHPICD